MQSNNEIVLDPDSLIADIQNQFNSFYPFLKIEFSKSNNTGIGKSPRMEGAFRIKDLTKTSSITRLNIDKSRTVQQLANDCMHTLGLLVKVLRKSGNVWNVISVTDNWTLENQNDAGRFISSEMTGLASGTSTYTSSN